MTELETLFRSPACINASFLHENSGNMCCTQRYSGVNLALAEKAFSHIRKLENESLKQVVRIIFFFFFDSSKEKI